MFLVKLIQPSLKRSLERVIDPSFLEKDLDNLESASLEGLSLADISLHNFSLVDSSIYKCDFSLADMEKFDLNNIVIKDCIMSSAKFSESSWHIASIMNSRCSGIQLNQSVLKNIRFENCKLDIANFRFAKLTNVVFDTCVINEMDFYGAELKHVRFIDSDIDKVDFSQSKLVDVDLRESSIITVKRPSDLKGATITTQQLIQLSPQLAAEANIEVKD